MCNTAETVDKTLEMKNIDIFLFLQEKMRWYLRLVLSEQDFNVKP